MEKRIERRGLYSDKASESRHCLQNLCVLGKWGRERPEPKQDAADTAVYKSDFIPLPWPFSIARQVCSGIHPFHLPPCSPEEANSSPRSKCGSDWCKVEFLSLVNFDTLGDGISLFGVDILNTVKMVNNILVGLYLLEDKSTLSTSDNEKYFQTLQNVGFRAKSSQVENHQSKGNSNGSGIGICPNSGSLILPHLFVNWCSAWNCCSHFASNLKEKVVTRGNRGRK